MKIGIIGYGKMGRLVKELATEKGHEVVTVIDRNSPEAEYREITKESVAEAEVLIEFTHPESVFENIKKASELEKNIVVGTTGWDEKTNDVKKIIQKNQTGLIYASNFSVGMNIFFRTIRKISKLMNKFEEYDVSGVEIHHAQKADKPSGTAKTLEKIITENIKRKKNVEFKSIREGEVPGTHTIKFDSKADSIELTHAAKNRKGFASGAIKAAEWIKNKKGFYSIEDMMKEIME